MHQYICLGRNHGMTSEQEVHIREERSISLKFQKKAFPLSKDLALSYLEKIGSVEAPHKWCTILTHWYAIDTNWPCYSSRKYFYTGVKQYIPVLLVGKRFVETILDSKSFFFFWFLSLLFPLDCYEIKQMGTLGEHILYTLRFGQYNNRSAQSVPSVFNTVLALLHFGKQNPRMSVTTKCVILNI